MKFTAIVALISTSKAVCDWNFKNTFHATYDKHGAYNKVSADGMMRRIGYNGDSRVSLYYPLELNTLQHK